MQIKWTDRVGTELTLTMDLLEITTKQAIVIQGYTGMTLKPWMQAIGEGDPKAVTAACWLAYAQTGMNEPIEGFDIHVMQFYAAFNAAAAAERAEAAEKEQDPPLATEGADEAPEVAAMTSTPRLSAVNI